MKKTFIVDQKSLFDILSSMQPICTRRTTTEATGSLLFNVGHKELVIKSTDLEISLQASCALISSTIAQAETFLVTGKRIFDIVKELDGDITCELAHNQLTLKASSATVSLNTKESSEFPPFPERIENLMGLDAPLLVKMLESVAFLIPQNNSNPALNGLLLEISPDMLAMTTTDGHCLARVTTGQYTLPEKKSWLMPRRAIFELKKILDTVHDTMIFVGTCGNQLVFSGELFNFFTKLLADTFPQYQQILDKTSFTAGTIDRSQFSKTLRRSACLLSGQFLATQFGFSPYKLRVLMNNKEVGTLEEELTLKAENLSEMTIRFYAPYLLSGLQAFPDESVTFYLKNSSAPIMFEAQHEVLHMTYLVMPVSASSV